MKQQLDITVYIFHIRDAIQKIENYAEKNTYEDFLQNDWDQDAVIRNLEIIGEALSHINQEFRNSHPAIPWRKIIALRNVLIHAYFGIDLDLVWKIITKNVPELKLEIEKILQEVQEEE